MNSPLLDPAFVPMQIFWKWTFLLAAAWGIHLALRVRHSRLRVWLWRSVLVLSVLLPLAHYIVPPAAQVPLAVVLPWPEAAQPSAFAPLARIESPSPKLAKPSANQAVAAAGQIVETPSVPESPHQQLKAPWAKIALLVWLGGCLYGVVRHLRLSHELRKILETARPDNSLPSLVEQLKFRMNITRPVEVRLSPAVSSPFVCGILRPAILIPEILVENFESHASSSRELRLLLSHELGHILHQDLGWSAAWGWLRTVCWFHPLVWAAPRAHNLACEQEADRLASDQVGDRNVYAQTLAQLALRLLAQPRYESNLSLHATSQLSERLKHLARDGVNSWSAIQSLAALGSVLLLFFITVGCDFSNGGTDGGPPVGKTDFKEVLVTVLDEASQPIEGAKVLPDGFRVKGIHGADAYHWGPNLFGGPVAAITDSQGKAYVRYPVIGIPEEKEYTGKLIFSVFHKEFATTRKQEYSVDGSEAPLHLTRGIPLEVFAYYGPDHQPVEEFIPNLSQEGARPEDWQPRGPGRMSFHKLSPGGHMVQLMGRLGSGEIVYSEAFAFKAEPGKTNSCSLEMKRGNRLEGRLDDRVPRPVKHGRVNISVRPKQIPAYLVPEDYSEFMKQYGYFHFWKSYREISPDGTFVFECIPPGDVDVIVHGEGFISSNGGAPSNRINGKLVGGLTIGVPQAFVSTPPTTKIEVATERPATLEVTARTKAGAPIPGATVYVNPNVMRIQTGIFGNMRESSDAPFREEMRLPDVGYSAVTDDQGVAVIRNIPACARGLEIEHPQFQIPLQEPKGWRSRHIRCEFTVGETQRLALVLERKGKEFIGSPK